MPMAYNIQDLFSRPMGKGAFSNTTMVKNAYRRRYLELYRKKKSEFTHNIYEKDDIYYIHITIPSENVDKVIYDIVFKFTPHGINDIRDTTVDEYNVNVFSNCPSFTYGYAYVFNEHDMLIDEFKDLFHKPILKKEPKVRNPDHTMGHEKSLYFAYFYYQNNLLNIKDNLDDDAKRPTKRNLFDMTKPEDKEMERKEKDKKERLKAKRKRKAKKGKTRTRENVSPKIQSTSRGSHRITEKTKVSSRSKITPRKKR